jgi:hypothetical protein
MIRKKNNKADESTCSLQIIDVVANYTTGMAEGERDEVDSYRVRGLRKRERIKIK